MSQYDLKHLKRIFDENSKKHFLTPLEQVILMGKMCKEGDKNACDAYGVWITENEQLAIHGNEVSKEMMEHVRSEIGDVITT